MPVVLNMGVGLICTRSKLGISDRLGLKAAVKPKQHSSTFEHFCAAEMLNLRFPWLWIETESI